MLSAVTVLMVVCVILAATATVATTAENPDRPMIVAHRGASGAAPENTMAAFERAFEIGVDFIELDVHETKDGQIMVIHDATVDRTAKGGVRGPIANLTFEQIRALDAGSWKAPEYAGEKIPTFHEVLVAFKGRAKILIEIKATGIEQKVADIILATEMEDSVFLQSFDVETVRRCRQLLPQVPAGVLYSRPAATFAAMLGYEKKVMSTAADVGASFIGVDYRALNAKLVNRAKAEGLKVYAWTVNEETDMRSMMEMGVNGIISNYPDVVKRLVESL